MNQCCHHKQFLIYADALKKILDLRYAFFMHANLQGRYDTYSTCVCTLQVSLSQGHYLKDYLC